LALVLAGIGEGDEVIVPAMTFATSANVVVRVGAKPVFVDVDLDTFNMDASQLAAAIGPRTKAILAVHQLGMPCDLDTIISVARDHRLPVIEDAACAIGSQVRMNGSWEPIGRPHGDIACFSFHPRKLLSTGDGGMLTTHNAEFDRQFRLLRHHGMSVSDTVRHQSAAVTFEAYPVVGYNYRLTDIQAAIGREQLKRLPSLVARRRELADRYQAAFRGHPGVTTPAEPEWARSNWQSYAIRVAPGRQRAVMQALLDEGISTRRGVMNAHREAAYPEGTWRVAPGQRLERSEEAQDTAIMLPLFHDLQDVDQDRVIDAIIRASSRT
jgi:dTDP-4-amino-4,6-dideoxygalactose transaminase